MADKTAGTRPGSELPASIERAWGLRARPAKGPKRGLSLEQIVEAAVTVAATDGLDAVSMSRVAAEIGSATMSLYRYVASKDELLMLMVDLAGGNPPAATDPNESWRAGLARWAEGYRDLLRRHPWVLRIPINGPPITPNQIAWLENGLHTMRDTPLHEAEKLSTVLLISGFVRNEATLVTDISAAAKASGSSITEVMPRYGRLLETLTDPAQFPALHKAIAAGAFDLEDEEDDEFYFGLDRILDGIDVLVRMGDRLSGA